MVRAKAGSQVPAVAAIVPARNAAATLARCLDALTAQASDDPEVIVVDDGSTNKTFEIASRHDVWLLKRERRVGPSAA